MTKLKAKRLLRMAQDLEAAGYPVTAAEIRMLVGGALNPPHPVTGPRSLHRKVTAGMKEAIDEVLQKIGDQVALAGGHAVIQWIDIRETFDADFVVLGPTFERLGEIFPGGEMKEIIYTVNIQGEDVDFLKPEYFPWTDAAMRAAVLKPFMGHQVKVLSPEFLCLYKFQAGRERDVTDILALLTLPGVPEKATGLVARYMPEELEDFKQMVLEAEYGL